MADFWEPESERRTGKRKALGALAWADPGGVLPVIDCKILDLSQDGARVVAPTGLDMPELFQLQIDSSRILGTAQVMWRESNQVGVKFLARL